MMNSKKSILETWDITEGELTELVNSNPSLRGMLLGYIAESTTPPQAAGYVGSIRKFIILWGLLPTYRR
ncbi:MAG: hypothetical protein Pg6C_04120 [Treponemataceae bacterium]|nr:MAG: hypothetical protein Pg6C_04120 [Treponemataceae bacterium]